MRTEEVLRLLQDVAERVINPRFRVLRTEEVAEKNPGDLVTIADQEAEIEITAALAAAYPEAVILGEEATATDDGIHQKFRGADHAFTVDPIDGTRNFVAGSVNHAVMAAELRDGVVVRSWIWQPQLSAAYVAERGRGAWFNGQRLVRPPVGRQPRGVTSRRRWLGRTLPGLAPLELTWVSCGVDYPKLAEGAADYVVYGGTQPWDHAPGSLLLAEAGAYLGTFDGEPYRPQAELPSGLVGAANRETYELVQSKLDALDA